MAMVRIGSFLVQSTDVAKTAGKRKCFLERESLFVGQHDSTRLLRAESTMYGSSQK